MSGFVRFWCSPDDRLLKVVGAEQTAEIGQKRTVGYSGLDVLSLLAKLFIILGINSSTNPAIIAII